MTEAQWIDAFCQRMSDLGVRAEPQMIESMGCELRPTLGHMDPKAAADQECANGLPHDD